MEAVPSISSLSESSASVSVHALDSNIPASSVSDSYFLMICPPHLQHIHRSSPAGQHIAASLLLLKRPTKLKIIFIMVKPLDDESQCSELQQYDSQDCMYVTDCQGQNVTL